MLDHEGKEVPGNKGYKLVSTKYFFLSLKQAVCVHDAMKRLDTRCFLKAKS